MIICYYPNRCKRVSEDEILKLEKIAEQAIEENKELFDKLAEM